MLPGSTSRVLGLPQERVEPLARRTWRARLGDAYRGVKLGMRGQSSFAVHFFFAALITAFAVAVDCSVVEWCLLTGAVGIVVTAELFNAAIENLVRSLDDGGRQRARSCLDISAGAVLAATLCAGLLGCIIFAAKLWNLFQHL